MSKTQSLAAHVISTLHEHHAHAAATHAAALVGETSGTTRHSFHKASHERHQQTAAALAECLKSLKAAQAGEVQKMSVSAVTPDRPVIRVAMADGREGIPLNRPANSAPPVGHELASAFAIDELL